jgi:glycosyltransferase involved in cell wall biosynthesis
LQRRRVLILAYFFPPLGGAGVQRTAKFVKYLPSFGWDPTVITTRSRWYPARDPSLAADIPRDIRVVSARELVAARELAVPAGLMPPVAKALTWPDEMSGWFPFALRAALREVKRDRPDVLFTTSAPYSAHLVGLIVKRTTGIPWVADFRDEWASNPETPVPPAPFGALTRAAERAVVRAADRIVVTSDAAIVSDDLAADKRTTITNGVDPSDFDAATSLDAADRFRVSFVGTLYAERDCKPVLAALGRLAARGDIDAEQAEFRVVGNIWLPQPPAAGRVAVVEAGYLPHDAAIAEMKRASLLVVYLPSVGRGIPGKLFEYLASGRPVLCVTQPGNPAAQIVRELGAGYAVAPDDAPAIEAALIDAWTRWQSGAAERDLVMRRKTAFQRFGREALTGKLAAVLESALSR